MKSVYDVDVSKLNSCNYRLELNNDGIVVEKRDDGYYISSSTEKRLICDGYIKHETYYHVKSILQAEKSMIVYLYGPTQCGKSSMVHAIGNELGRKVYQINCRGDMGSELFFGQKTIEIDDETKQNKITYQKGIIEQAMVEGLDENGNEVGAPGILFIDEISACPANIAHGLNRLFESGDTLVIAEDGGRVVKAHSGFRIVLAGNTNGRGVSDSTAEYRAQYDALDLSLLHRIAAFINLEYNDMVENELTCRILEYDKYANVIRQLWKFRDTWRNGWRKGQITTPISTSQIIHFCELVKIFGGSKVSVALKYAILNGLVGGDAEVVKEIANACFA